MGPLTVNTVTTMPEAMKVIKGLERDIDALKMALRYDLIPAWVVQDVMDENKALKEKLRKIGT